MDKKHQSSNEKQEVFQIVSLKISYLNSIY